MELELLQKALKAAQKGQKYAFATIIEATLKGTPRKSGAKMLVLADGTSYGTIGGGRNEKAAHKECVEAIRAGRPKTVTYDYFGHIGQSVCGGQIKVYIEPYGGERQFVLCGAGHIGLPLSMVAKMLNYQVTVIDNRREFANKKRLPHADKILVGDYAAMLRRLKIDENTHLMIVTQGNEFDYECLKTIVKSKAGYIGVISSKAKRVKFFKRLKEAGIQEKYLKRIRIPAGIDIGAQSPAELAVAIASEMVQTTNQEFIGTDKFIEKHKEGVKQ